MCVCVCPHACLHANGLDGTVKQVEWLETIAIFNDTLITHACTCVNKRAGVVLIWCSLNVKCLELTEERCKYFSLYICSILHIFPGPCYLSVLMQELNMFFPPPISVGQDNMHFRHVYKTTHTHTNSASIQRQASTLTWIKWKETK